MIRNVLSALAYYAEGLARVPVVLWALAALGVVTLLLELAAARSATLRNRALGEGRLLDGSRFVRATLEGAAGQYVLLGTSIEHGKTASLSPALTATESRWQCDDGSALIVPAGTKLRIEGEVPDARHTLNNEIAGENGGHTYDFAVRAGDALWLRGPMPEPASPVHGGVHRASDQRVLAPDVQLFATAQKPPAQGEAFGWGCAAVPLMALPALFVAGVRTYGTGTLVATGLASSLVLWRIASALRRLQRTATR